MTGTVEMVRAPRLRDAFLGSELEVVAPLIDRMLHDGIVVQDAAGAIVYFNPKALELLRMSADELMGVSSLDPRWQSITVDGDPYPGERHPSMVALQTGEDLRNELMGVRVGDESLRWLSIDASAVDAESGRFSITVFTDVTDEFENHRELRRTQAEIQAQLLQRDFPSHERIRFASSYRATGMSRTIGGDFLGAHAHAFDRFGVFVGDVCGHGVAAAGLSSVARNTLRALSRVIEDPSALLHHLHDVVEQECPDMFVTAVAGTVEAPLDGAVRFRFALGGHPPPIVLRDRRAFIAGESGALVGMVANRDRPVTELILLPGDRVLMYTDGVLDGGEPRLSTPELAAALPTDRSLDDTLAWMMCRGLGGALSAASDDAAVLGFDVR